MPQRTVPGLRWWITTVLIGSTTFVMALDRAAMTIAAPVIQKEFSFTLQQMSYILAAFSWTYALFQIPSGWLAERFGPRRILFGASMLWSIFTAATPFGIGLRSLVTLRSLLGVGQAADWPSSVVAIKRWFPLAERAKGNSILLGALYLGRVAAGPIAAAVIVALGWKPVFMMFGAAGAVVSLCWYLGFRDDPARHPLIGMPEAELIEQGRGEAIARPQPGTFARLARSSQFWAMGLQYFCVVMIMTFYTTWLPTYLSQERHLDMTRVGGLSSLPFMALFLVVLGAGRLADAILRRTGSIWMARVPPAMIGFVVSAIALTAAMQMTSLLWLMVLLCVSLGSIGLIMVSIWSSAQDLGGSATGVVTGWTNCWGNGADAVGAILLAQLVAWTGTWAGALLALAGAGIAGPIIWLFVHPERPIDHTVRKVEIPVNV
jgi:ACS family glucarate transporter-like MFS transporter